MDDGPNTNEGQDDVRVAARRLVVLHELLRGSPHSLSCHCGNPQNGGATCAGLQAAVNELRGLVFPEVAAAERAERQAFEDEVRARKGLIGQRPVPQTDEDDFLSRWE